MAVILDKSLLKFTKLELSLKTDRRSVETTALKRSIYTTGATRWDIKCEVITSTAAEDAYFGGIFIPNYLDNQTFELELTSEYNLSAPSSSTTDDYEVAVAVTAGSNTLTVRRGTEGQTVVDLEFARGNYFKIAGSDRLYTINKYTDESNILVFAPKLDKSIAVGAKITISDPKISLLCVSKSINMKSSPQTKNYKTVALMFEEDL